MANFRSKINMDLGFGRFTGYRPTAGMRSDTGARPVQTEAGKVAEALADLSPTLFQLAAFETDIEKSRIKREVEGMSLEERKAIAQGEALEEERSNPLFAGSNAFRKIYAKESLGRRAAESVLVDELEGAAFELADDQKSIEEIDVLIDGYISKHRPEDAFERRAYDAAAAAVRQQKRSQYLAARSRKSIDSTQRALEDDLQLLYFGYLNNEQEADPIAMRDMMEEYKRVHGGAGRDEMRKVWRTVAATWAQKSFEDGMSREEIESHLYSVRDGIFSTVDGSQTDKPINDFRGYHGQFPWVYDPESGVPSNVMLTTHEVDGKFIVVPSMEGGQSIDEDVLQERVLRSGEDDYPMFATQGEADAWAKKNHGNVMPDGTLKKASQPKNQDDLANPVDLIDDQLAMSTMLDRLEQNKFVTENRQRQQADRELFRLEQEMFDDYFETGDFEQTVEKFKGRYRAIGEKYGMEDYMDEDLFVENKEFNLALRQELEERGTQVDLRTRLYNDAMNGRLTTDDIRKEAHLSTTDRKVLLAMVASGASYRSEVQSVYTESAFNEALLELERENSDLGSVLSTSYSAELYEAFVNQRTADLLATGVTDPADFAGAVQRGKRPIILEVQAAIKGIDVVVNDEMRWQTIRLLPQAQGVLKDMGSAGVLRGEVQENADGMEEFIVATDEINEIGKQWIREWKQANPDKTDHQMNRDFVAQFRPYYESLAKEEEVAQVAEEDLSMQEARQRAEDGVATEAELRIIAADDARLADLEDRIKKQEEAISRERARFLFGETGPDPVARRRDKSPLYALFYGSRKGAGVEMSKERQLPAGTRWDMLSREDQESLLPSLVQEGLELTYSEVESFYGELPQMSGRVREAGLQALTNDRDRFLAIAERALQREAGRDAQDPESEAVVLRMLGFVGPNKRGGITLEELEGNTLTFRDSSMPIDVGEAEVGLRVAMSFASTPFFNSYEEAVDADDKHIEKIVGHLHPFVQEKLTLTAQAEGKSEAQVFRERQMGLLTVLHMRKLPVE